MKGFGIYVKNDLLDPKHIQAMGPKSALWLYLWLLDKITSISEEGIGKILGGKPIVSEEVTEELGVSDRTFRRWVTILKKYGYINVTRTPRGLSLSLNKAEKIFGNKGSVKTDRSPDRTQLADPRSGVTDHLDRTDRSNRDSTVDNTSDSTVLTPAKEMRSFLVSIETGDDGPDGVGPLLAALVKKGIPENTARNELTKFARYWSEKSPSGRKVRWEMERTFELRRRLVTWFNNAQKFSRTRETKGVRI